MKFRLLLVLGLLAFSATAGAQISQLDPEYLENMYGPVVDVDIDSLAFNTHLYDNKAVRVKGRIGILGISGDSF